MSKKLISIVVPAYNEAECLSALHEQIKDALDKEKYLWELIIVNDGSSDGTREIIEQLAKEDARVRGLHFARNFGHQYALLAGMEDARGDAVITIDADLQQPPRYIIDLIRKWKEGFQVVHGVRLDHPEISLFKRTTSRWFYRVFSFLSRVPIEPGMLDFRLMDRQVVNAVLSISESDFFLRGITTWIGFRQAKVEFQSDLRSAGETKYTTGKMISFALKGITSFSTFPLRLATYLGCLVILFSFGYGVYVALNHFLWANPQPGYTLTILLISFLMGVQFLLIGLLGEYVARIHVEVKRRPRYFVAAKTENKSKNDDVITDNEVTYMDQRRIRSSSFKENN